MSFLLEKFTIVTVWSIWRARNGSLFNNRVLLVQEVVEKIKVFVALVPWSRSLVSMYVLQMDVVSSKVYGQLIYLTFQCGEGVSSLGCCDLLSLFLSWSNSLIASR